MMSDTSKNWLCLITSDKELENIDEMTRDIWTHFDGICAVVHTQGGDRQTTALLEDRKQAGFVIERSFLWHHGHSMNEWLLDRRINLMDCCWIRDSSERFNPNFTAELREFSAGLLAQNIWNAAQYSKLLMFRRWYNQQFFNGLHWGLSGTYGVTVPLDRYPKLFANDRDYAYSVRNEKRPADHRYRHELLYLLDYGQNGNHLQLYHNDPQELGIHQWDFYRFTQYLRGHGVITADQLIVFLKEQKMLDTQLKFWLNNERPLRNAYRYFILNHANEEILKDEDTWRIL